MLVVMLVVLPCLWPWQSVGLIELMLKEQRRVSYSPVQHATSAAARSAPAAAIRASGPIFLHEGY
jgi:hypothetical protein